VTTGHPRGKPRDTQRDLRALARLYGCQTSFEDVDRRRRYATDGTLLAVLGPLGAPVAGPEDVPAALKQREQDLWARPVEPVVVAWGGRVPPVKVRLPARVAPAVRTSIFIEEGPEIALARPGGAGRDVAVHGARFVELQMRTREHLPHGYHRLVVEAGAVEGHATVISAPVRCPQPDPPLWGTFLPLYALRRRGDWGVGSFADLQELRDWTANLGGSTVGTLPLLAAFLGDEVFEPSPYSPVSRLFWNELFVTPERAPELERSAAARDVLASPEWRDQLRRVRRSRLVDYRGAMAAKRRVLESLAEALFGQGPSPRLEQFERRMRTDSQLGDYARFRAYVERTGTTWQQWSAPQHRGRIRPHDVDPRVERYHAYVQWLAAQQVEALRPEDGGAGSGLFLDLPLGVDPGGYDTWRHRESFALGANGGAPPDAFFQGGQDWGFPPLHPDRIRENGYRYPVDCLRHLLANAGVLRVDHIMGLHRLYWVPRGMDARHGVYVRYRPDEWYALLALESHRAGCAVVGEDLGTVPKPVRRSMRRHGVLRSHIVQLEAQFGSEDGLLEAPRGSLAALNTHDMPPFAAFWRGTDIHDMAAGGLLDDAEAAVERRRREGARRRVLAFLRRAGRLPPGRDPPLEAVLLAVLEHLAAGRASLVVVNLEDLWLETESQNRPGTSSEHPNWRLRAARTFEEFRSDPRILGTLREMDRLRREARR
jgi:4-alpha-glucanotransferase